MNDYKYNDLSIGQREEFQVDITDEILNKFKDITGDINPIHCDDEFARRHGFNARIAYGMLTASFLSTLAGVYLPGKYSLIQSVEIKFVSPVLIGDKLLVTGTISELHESVRQIVLRVVITAQDGRKVARGIMKLRTVE